MILQNLLRSTRRAQSPCVRGCHTTNSGRSLAATTEVVVHRNGSDAVADGAAPSLPDNEVVLHPSGVGLHLRVVLLAHAISSLA